MKTMVVKVTAFMLVAMMLLSTFAACAQTVDNFNLSFVVDGETYSTISTNGNEAISIPNDPTKEGYQFVGWYWDENVWSKPFTANSLLDAPISSNMQIFAKFKPISYAVKYEADGGTHNNPASYTIEDSFNLSDPIKAGYGFLGWYDADNSKVAGISLGSMGDKTLYAKYSATVFNIKYENVQGAKNNNVSSYTAEDEEIALSSLERPGYIFDGWYNGDEKVTKIPSGSIGDITLTAKWSVIGYEITYNNVVGATNGNPLTYDVEDEPLALEAAAKAGYTFMGWYSDAEFKNKVTEISVGTTGSLELYAKWDIVTYTVNYENTKGVENSNVTTFTVEDVITLSELIKAGYTFEGWYNGDTEVTEIAKGSTGDITLTAKWSVIGYGITYHNAEGASNSNPEGYDVEDQPLPLVDAEKVGYTFKGWYTDEALTNKITEVSVGTTGNIDLYAKWEIIEYTATFKDDESVVGTVKFTVETDSITAPEVPDHIGYIGAWESYTLGTEDITVNAVYTPVTYTVTYTNTKDVTNTNATTFTVESADIILTDLSKVGYTFDGWYNGDEKVTKISSGSVGDIILEARWTAIEYIITYVYDDQIGGLDEGVVLKTIYTIEDEFDFEKLLNYTPGYNFIGWYTEKNNGTGTRVDGIEKGSIGDRLYYAQWGINTFMITYHNAKDTVNTNPLTYTIETDDFTISDISKTGYNFLGWYTDSVFKTLADLTVEKGSTGNIDLYAKWEETVYSITYNLYGGTYTSTENPENYTISQAVTFIDPIQSGYVFVGWYDAAEGGKLVKEIVNGSTGNVTLYARWLKFDSKSGSAVSYTPTYSSSGVSKPTDPTREHYTFGGWYTNETLTSAFNFNQLPSKSMTLYAKWIPVEYKITYILNDGTNGKNPETYNIKDIFTFEPATKTGYIFNGWYTDPEFTSAIVEGIKLGSHGEITIYANFSINKYTISFNSNGGTDVEPIKQNYGTSVEAPEPPARNGYKFVGWYGDSSLTQKYTFTTIPAQNITLYAKWELVTYNITYNLDGGTNASGNPKTFTINSSKITLQNPTKRGYTFGGWYTDSEYKNPVTEIANGSYGDKEIFAKWNVITYTVTYDVPTGTTNGNLTSYTVETDITALLDASREGYTFNGWFSDSNYRTPVTSIAGGSIGNITVYGKFTANTYNVWLDGRDTESVEVTFDLNGASGTAPAKQTVTNTNSLKYPTIPTREGYLFGGWYANAECTGEAYDFTAYLAENVTLYAKWVSLDGGNALSVNGSTSVTMAGTEEKVYRFIPLVSGNISITTSGSVDTFGMLYKNGTLLKQDDDSGAQITNNANNFLIVYNVKAGEVYEIRVRGFGSSSRGTTELSISGNNTVADGGTVRMVNEVTLTYGEAFTLPIPTPTEYYKFLGWQSADGTMYTDVDGNSIKAWDIAADTVLTSKWEKMEYTITFETNGGTAIDPIKLEYGEAFDFDSYVTTKAGSVFVAWYMNSSGTEMCGATMPDHNITLYAKWATYVLKTQYNTNKTAISVNDELTPELFGAVCTDTNGNNVEFTNVALNGTKAAGETVTIRLTAQSQGKNAVITIQNVKVYGEPTLTLGDTSKDYINLDNLVGSWFSASGTDSFGNATSISVRVEEGKVAGDTATVYVDSTDASGNVKTEAVENIKLYGKPTITYDTEKTAVSINDTLSAELYNASAVDSFGESLTVSVTRYSGTISAGNTVTIRISAIDSKGNVTNIDISTKVYGMPTITSVAKTEFKVDDSITPELLGITAKDTYKEPLAITLSTKSGTQTAGQTMVITATVTDISGNVTTKDYSVKIYGTPAIVVGREELKANETISLNTFNVTSKDSFGNTLSTTYELVSGTQTGGTSMTYRFTATDKLGNTYSVEKAFGVYDVNDITLHYSNMASDMIKESSKGEEFSFSATDSFGNACTLTVENASGAKPTAGQMQDIYLVATDKAGNKVKSELITGIKVYGMPTITYLGKNEKINANEDVSFLFIVNDSFGAEIFALVDAEEHSVVGENFNVTVTATDDAGNTVSQSFELRVQAESDYVLTLKGDGTYTLSSYVGTESNVYVPTSMNGIKITSIASNAFENNTTMKTVLIPNTITSIGSSAFSGCTNLVSITIPSSVTSIGSSAFSGCSSLESIALPFVGGSVKTSSDTYQYPFGYIFGTSSYTGGVATKQYYYGSSTSSRTYDTYYIPATLKSVTITGGNVLYGAFYNCSSLTSITIPDNVTSIGSSAFYNCTSLESITIPNSVTSIGDDAFYNCTSLNAVYITDIAKWCNINFQYSYANPLYYAPNLYLNGSLVTDLVIPSGVASIGSYAFYNCTSLESITIPDSVTTIGSYAFSDCTSLTSITIPDSVTSIGYAAFSDCSSLESITLPFVGGSVKTSSDTYQYPFGYIFGESSSTGGVATKQYYYGSSTSSTTYDTYYIPATLKSVTITGGNVLYGAFYNCSSLTSVTIGDSVKRIGDNAFKYCYKLVEVYNLSSSLTITKGSSSNGSVGYYALDIYTSADEASKISITDDGYIFYENGDTVYLLGYSGGDTTLSLPDKFNGKNYSIYKYAFYNCTSLESITIPDSVTSIGGYAFYVCTSLTSVTFGENSQLTSIGSGAFGGCTSLNAVYITDIAKWCNIDFGYSEANPLYYAHNLYLNGSLVTDLVIPSGVTIIGGYAFSGCTSLESITIPDSVTSIGGYAFYVCTSLTSVTIGDSVKSIGVGAFFYCTSLTSIIIPDSVTSIGDYAFEYCRSLESITIPEGVTSIGSDAFINCTSLTRVTFSDTTTWYVTTSIFYSVGTPMSVTNASMNVTYFQKTYSGYYWYKV